MISSMTSRLISGDDYETAQAWWRHHKHPVVPQDILPKCGVAILGKDGKPMAMGWLNLDNSGVGVSMLNWIVTNPENKPVASSMAIRELAEASRQVANELGYGVMMVTATTGISRLLRRAGFVQVSSVPHFHLTKITH
jgi:hypothetical protein